ncbi:aggrecan core protein-like [Acipenser oxyrinchus oxyrinchus]|uniref:Aggrecan core protein-like n=1 Tax=Acipenser oxyrinchus oxyrinchus TaxID=40147 RepID=A0AAD8D269_ACIOX|nr:aggrecan core protein-like [Acipenser oxyrinchus oxyrinchus]
MKILFCLVILLHTATSETYDMVVSGVFESNSTTYNYTQSREYCLSQNATLATLEQVTRAQNTSFQTCRFGWVEEQQIILARTTANKSCGSNHIGIIKQEACGYYIAPSAYCYKIKVLRGVFHVDSPSVKYSLTFPEATATCARLNATMATENQLRVAHGAGFETCRAGWVAEQKIFIPRITSTKSCANGTTGVQEYPGTNKTSDVFCFRNDLYSTDVYVVYPPFGNSTMTYSEAMQQCLSLGDSLASKEQLRSAPTPISDGIPGWSNDNDVVQFSNGNLTVTPCVNELSQLASAYCFNPNVTYFTPVSTNDDKLWLKITIGCIIAAICVIFLVVTVACIRVNKCVCCARRKKQAQDSTLEKDQGYDTAKGLYLPKWNKTGMYTPKDDMFHQIPTYQDPGTKLSVRSKSLNTAYRTHYFTNHGFESTPEDSKQSFDKTHLDRSPADVNPQDTSPGNSHEYINAAFDGPF